jgi:hypothetical protein
MQRDEAATSGSRPIVAATRVPTQVPAQTDADDFVDSARAVADEVAAAEEPPELDERGQRILAFEKQWWRQAGAKEQAIRDAFGLSATRYYQLLNALLDDPLAIGHDPVLVARLRRLRASRTRRRGSA